MSAEVAEDGTLTIIKGDDIRIPMSFVVAGVPEVPVDLTGATIKSQIKTIPGGSFASLTFDVIEFEPLLGSWTLHASHEDVQKLRKTDYWWDCQITFANGVVQTILGPAPVINIIDVTI